MSFIDPPPLEDNHLEFLAEAMDGVSEVEASVIAGLAEHRVEIRWIETMRRVHSLKGGAGMLGFGSLSQAAHHLENALHQIRHNEISVSSETVRLLLRLVDSIKQIIQLNRSGSAPAPHWLQDHLAPLVEALIAELGEPDEEELDLDLLEDDESQFIKIAFETEIADYLEQWTIALAEGTAADLKERIQKISHELENLGYMLNLEEMVDLCRHVQAQLTDHPEQVLTTAQSGIEAWKDLQRRILQLETIAESEATSARDPGPLTLPKIESEPDVPATDTMSSVRVDSRNLDELSHELEELSINCNSLTVRLQRLEQIIGRFGEYTGRLSQTQDALRVMYDQRLPSLPLSSDGFDPLEMDRYSQLHPIWQEMIELAVRLQEVHSDTELVVQDLDSTLDQLHHTSGSMQKRLQRVRMQPIEGILHPLQRSTWEIADQLGKRVQLELRGEKTRIERRILEKLRDPLMHLLRNALDHGIEVPEQRQALGKPATGQILVSTESRGHHILITVSDDGQGIDLDRLRQKTGRFQASDAELIESIFEPGLSTAGKVTEISGRGIGMDVVRSHIEEMGGRVEVTSLKGKGTHFALTVPSSLSALRAVIVEKDGLIVGIPARQVIQLLLVEPEQLIEGPEGPILKLGNEILVPKLDLLETLARSGAPTLSRLEETATVDHSCLLLLSQGSRVGFIAVDRCWREREMVMRQVEGIVRLPAPFSGCSILGDGQILPIINVTDLFNRTLSLPQMQPRPDREEIPIGVLVVDDSIHIRQHLCRALEKEGFRTIEAKDGQEAIEKLRSGLEVQGVISDIEMPRLDGYGLLGAMQQLPHLASIPVLMLTSRSGNKHRQRAMQLGAADYIVKPCRENELIDRLQTLVRRSAHVAYPF